MLAVLITLTTGVPRGIFLGPLPFILCRNDILSVDPEGTILSHATDSVVIRGK